MFPSLTKNLAIARRVFTLEGPEILARMAWSQFRRKAGIRKGRNDYPQNRLWQEHCNRLVLAACLLFAKFRKATCPTIGFVLDGREADTNTTMTTLNSLIGQTSPDWHLTVIVAQPDDYEKLSVELASLPPSVQARITLLTEKRMAEMPVYPWTSFPVAGAKLNRDYCAAFFRAFSRNNALKLFYGHDDIINDAGERSLPFWRPEFNPVMLGETDYLVQTATFHTESFSLEGALSPSAVTYGKIRPRQTHRENMVLVHQPAIQALQTPTSIQQTQETTEPSRDEMVSIIIPTRDRLDLLRKSVEGCLEQTAYQAIELIIVDNGSVEKETRDFFNTVSDRPNVRILPAPGPFNFAKLINLAAREARGEYLLLLNNDIEITEENWLSAMMHFARQGGAGAIGARLWHPDGSVQHAGLALDVLRIAFSPYDGLPASEVETRSIAAYTHDAQAVTGACMLLRKKLFHTVGGMDETNLAIAFNDVDLCLKIRKEGLVNICCAQANLVHNESASRGSDADHNERFLRERAYMRRKWDKELRQASRHYE